MDFKLTEDRRNELLQRRELTFTVTYNGPTPSRQQVLDKLSALLNLNQNLVVIDSLTTRFGKMEIQGTARLYDSQEMISQLERPYLLNRGKPKGEQEKGSPAPEEKKVEKEKVKK